MDLEPRGVRAIRTCGQRDQEDNDRRTTDEKHQAGKPAEARRLSHGPIIPDHSSEGASCSKTAAETASIAATPLSRLSSRSITFSRKIERT